MPIIGTPVLLPPVAPTVTTGYVVSPPVPMTFDAPILSKMRAAVIQQAQYAALKVQLFDAGALVPVDLTLYGLTNGPAPLPGLGSPAIKFRFMEAIGAIAVDADVQGVSDATTGIISCTVPDSVTANSGVYLCETGVFDALGRMLFSNTYYILVDRGLFTTSGTANPAQSGQVGAPSLHEIRLNLKDHPESNRLIDDYEFDVPDICEAIVRSVQFWNTAPPPLTIAYNTTNFPWRYQWMDGIAAHLFEAAASYYRRNNLKHQAGGLSIDDLNKEREYLQAWQMRYERWTKWTQMKKVELNVAEGFGVFGSPYAHSPSIRGGGYW